MANSFAPTSRHVLPNFRRFSDTVVLGELAPAGAKAPPALPANLDEILASWANSPTVAVAADLLSAAVVLGASLPEVEEAAGYVLERPDEVSLPLRSVAKRLTRPAKDSSEGENSTSLPRLVSLLDTDRKERIYHRIARLKSSTKQFSNNPILYAELARLYLILGQDVRAMRNMQIALTLAPHNRFILRSAARMFTRLGQADRAFDLLRRNPLTRRDPWLASAELAVAGVTGRDAHLIKRATTLINSGDFSPASLAELTSGIASFELLNGDRRQSRKLFKKALIAPNANTLAQTEWAMSRDRLFDFDVKAFDVSRNYEALALEAYNRGEWSSAVEHCESWFVDTPLSKRPILMASHLASVVLEDYATSQLFCQVGLLTQPHDPQLLNNYAYALALGGDPDGALAVIATVPSRSSIDDLRMQACLLATEGLAFFRKGHIGEGRHKYLESIELTSKVTDPSFRQLALLNYVREEVIAGQELPTGLVDDVKGMKIDRRVPTLLILRDKVVDLINERVGSKEP
jgi:tetratricopeptide (TPR) repeat protein